MEWFADEAFWQTLYPRLFTEQRFASAAAEIDHILALSGVQRGSVLDLCCGPGRHSVLLARMGFAVTAVDRSRFLLNKARELAAAVPVEFVEADMRDFVRPGTFHLALSMFTSFGYFETPDQDLDVLRNVKASLKKDGIFLIDVIGKEYLASRTCRTLWEESPEGELFIQHCDILPGWSRVRLQWLLIKKDRTLRFELEHNLYSGQEMVALLRKAGFSDVQIFGSLAGTPYDSSATRLVARARS